MTSSASEAADDTLLGRVVRSLRTVGLEPDVDVDLENVSFTEGERTTVGVVMGHFEVVVFYSVWPAQVPEDAVERITELVARANTELYDATLELDVDRGTVSARSSVTTTTLDSLDDRQLGLLLAAARDAAERAARRHHSALAAAVEGHSALDALGLRLG